MLLLRAEAMLETCSHQDQVAKLAAVGTAKYPVAIRYFVQKSLL